MPKDKFKKPTWVGRVEQRMKELGINQYQLHKLIDAPFTTVNSWFRPSLETPVERPSTKYLYKLAEALQCAPEWIITGNPQYSPIFGAKKAIQIPVLGKIPAGFPDTIAEEIVEYISLPDAPKNSYAIRVKGDSMSPNIKDGDYVLFINDGTLKSGDVVIVADEWNDAMVKRYRIKNREPLFCSDNPEYPCFKPNEHYRIIGKVVDIWSRRKP